MNIEKSIKFMKKVHNIFVTEYRILQVERVMDKHCGGDKLIRKLARLSDNLNCRFQQENV